MHYLQVQLKIRKKKSKFLSSINTDDTDNK